ncbi:MAG TPA: glycosyltransferase family 4 protein [Phycisphaerae bacterium]|nr:glycosyltransferase family 4 protein [Phycisphaerae bacterium]
MRITLINQFYVPDISPTAHLSASLAEGLAARGHTVSVVTSRGGYVEASRVETHAGENPRVYRLWTPRLGKKTILKRCIDYASFYVAAAWRMVRLPRQDVVISLTTPPYIAWTWVVHRWVHPFRRPRLILWNMDCYPDAAERAGVIRKGRMMSRAMRWLNRRLFKRLDHLVCLDGAMVELLMSQYGPRKRALPVTVIPNWEKATFFPRPSAENAPARWEAAERLGLAGKFVVLYLGNTGVGHPFETVIEAAKRLRDKPVVFLFVGGGKRWSWLEEAKKREGLENVVLHPYVQKEFTAGVMASAQAALITLGDDMAGVMSPSKLHANLAMGLPVAYVGPEGSNVDEAIERFGCGVSVRQGDVAGVVKFVEEAMGDRERLAGLQGKARGAFEAAYCDERTLPQFEQVLRAVTGGRAGREGAADTVGARPQANTGR